MYYPAPTEEYPRSRVRPSRARIVADSIALLGVVVGCASLFLHGWLNTTFMFASRGSAGAQILQQFGVNVDQEISRIANREIAAMISPTMWQYKDHAFQLLFALLIVTGLLLLVSLVAPRVSLPAHVLALLTSVGAVGVMIVALMHLRGQTDSLPARVGQAIATNPVTNRVLAATTGQPVLDAKPGVPMYMAIAGLAVTLIGALVALVFAAAQSSRNAAAVQ
ncbi:MAG: hypothetical protein M3176_06005 [Chloroflexota bacterium]|nr:hypothetical protein [Chloroflexota bacterium]MDQ6906367.1 hypothetical protein [Chloroflexota bacterium]